MTTIYHEIGIERLTTAYLDQLEKMANGTPREFDIHMFDYADELSRVSTICENLVLLNAAKGENVEGAKETIEKIFATLIEALNAVTIDLETRFMTQPEKRNLPRLSTSLEYASTRIADELYMVPSRYVAAVHYYMEKVSTLDFN